MSHQSRRIHKVSSRVGETQHACPSLSLCPRSMTRICPPEPAHDRIFSGLNDTNDNYRIIITSDENISQLSPDKRTTILPGKFQNTTDPQKWPDSHFQQKMWKKSFFMRYQEFAVQQRQKDQKSQKKKQQQNNKEESLKKYITQSVT